MSQTIPGSDPVYKRLYAFPDMVEDLLRSLFPADILGAVDLRSLGRLPAEYVGDDFRRRHGDAVWRARLRGAGGRWLYVLVLLEFQSSNDRAMALRVLEYTAMLYRELVRGGAAKLGQLPPVLPVVLYNGEQRWNAVRDVADLIDPAGPVLAPYQPSQRHAVLDERHMAADDPQLGRLTRAVLLLEQSRSAPDLARVAGLLVEWLGSPGRTELKRVFAAWLWTLWWRLERGGDKTPAAPPTELNLEDVKVTLEERVSRWPEPWIRQGMEQGIQQGMEQGIQRGMEQGIQRGMEQGIQRGMEQGIQRGVEQGLQQGLDRQRALLRRLVEARFGARTAERVFASLRQEEDEDRLAEMGEAIVRCETVKELLRRTGA